MLIMPHDKQRLFLWNSETHNVADALLGCMSCVEFAYKMVADLGSSVTSKLMERLWKLCGIGRDTSNPYHLQVDGLAG